MTDELDVSLKNRRVITHQKLVMGIPAKIFFGISAICGFGVVVFFMYLPTAIAFVAAFLLVFIFFAPLYIIHKDDVEAWQIFLRLLRSHDVFSPSRVKKVSMVVLAESDREIYEHHSLSLINKRTQ